MSIAEARGRMAALTGWTPYQITDASITAEIKKGRKPSDDWRPADQMTSEALSSAFKVKKALNESKQCFDYSLFTSPYDSPISLKNHWISTMVIGIHETHLAYHEDVLKVKKAITKACEEVKEYKRDVKRQLGKTEKSFISTKQNVMLAFDNAITLLTDFQKKISERQEEILNNPLSKDIRCKKKTIIALDKHFMAPGEYHKYEAMLERYFEEGLCFRENSQEDCSRWKGQVKGIRHLTTIAAHATHSLAKAIICAESIEKHKNDASFFKVSEEEKKEKREDLIKQAIERLKSHVRSSATALLFGHEGIEASFFEVPEEERSEQEAKEEREGLERQAQEMLERLTRRVSRPFLFNHGGIELDQPGLNLPDFDQPDFDQPGPDLPDLLARLLYSRRS